MRKEETIRSAKEEGIECVKYLQVLADELLSQAKNATGKQEQFIFPSSLSFVLIFSNALYKIGIIC